MQSSDKSSEAGGPVGSNSEDELLVLADRMQALISYVDADRRYRFVNKAYEDWFPSRTRERVIGLTVEDVIGTPAYEGVRHHVDAALAGQSVSFEQFMPYQDGEQRFIRVEYVPRTGASGAVKGFYALIQDISESKRIEAELRESESRLLFLSELDEALRASASATEAMHAAAAKLAVRLGASRCAYADVDADGDGFVIRSDYSAPGIASSAGTYSLDLFGPRAAADMRQGRTLIVRDVKGELASGEGRETFAGIGIAAIICCPLVKQGRLVAMMAVHQDHPRDWQPAEIELVQAVVERCWAHVERVGAEARLSESEERLQAITNSIDQMIWSTTPDGYHDYFNERWYDYTGVPHGSTDGDEWREIFHPDDQDRITERWGHSLETGEPYHIEYRLQHRSGAFRWVLGRAQCVRDASGRITRWFGTCTDIQEIVEAREVLARSREELEGEVARRTAERNRVWEMSQDLLAVMGFDGFLKAVNPAWTATLGHDEATLLSMPFSEQVHPDDHPAVRAVLARLEQGESIDRFEDRLRHADGSWRWIAWGLVPEGDVFYAVGRDITAEKEAAAELEIAQEALRQSQKMEAMGQLTGGVAHDFNNLLTPIVGALDLLQRRQIGGEREQRLIAGAAQSAERARVLVQRLLAFARRQPLQPTSVDIAELTRGMAELVASTTGPQIKVVVDAAEDLPPAKADPNQLEMAILNLAVNARDAMPDGGTLRISASAETVGQSTAHLYAGRYVRLSVADTGIGMNEATIARAVEPFFSTKGIGKGTGLGLSMAHGLASQLGGALLINSQPGIGTNVELWLPASAAAPTGQPGSLSERDESRPGGTVLLVDDEALVRATTADMLEELGFEVVEAESAEAALMLIERGLTPDLLVTDHLMPGMAGTELAREIRARLSATSLLIVSGYAEADEIGADLTRLTKPFSSADLAAALADAIRLQVDQI